MTYRFDWLNSGLDIIDPVVEIVLSPSSPNITKVDVVLLQYSVEIRLVTPQAKYGLILDQVQAASLDWNQQGVLMMDQILTRLEDYSV